MRNEYQRMSTVTQRGARALCVRSAYSVHTRIDHVTYRYISYLLYSDRSSSVLYIGIQCNFSLDVILHINEPVRMRNEYQRMSTVTQRGARALCVRSAYSVHTRIDHVMYRYISYLLYSDRSSSVLYIGIQCNFSLDAIVL